MDARDLDGLSRAELIAKAESLGIERASVLTRAELVDEIVRRSVTDPIERRIARGLLGVARDLVARVVERGLHLPDAAARIRAMRGKPAFTPSKPPIATVMLAEIYAAQGHRERALAVLDEVLARESDHAAARQLRNEIAASAEGEPAPEPDDAALAEAEEPKPPLPSSPAMIEPARAFAKDPAGPIGMLDDAPLPPRYDADEVVVMPVDPRTVFVYWEVRQATIESARAASPAGRLVLRIIAVTANWAGPSVETRDIEIESLVGDWFVRELPVGALLRAAVGWRAAASFEPISVAMDVSAPAASPAAASADELVRFSMAGTSREGSLSPPSAIAGAAERARRIVASSVAEGKGASSWSALAPAPWGTLESVSSPGPRGVS